VLSEESFRGWSEQTGVLNPQLRLSNVDVCHCAIIGEEHVTRLAFNNEIA